VARDEDRGRARRELERVGGGVRLRGCQGVSPRRMKYDRMPRMISSAGMIRRVRYRLVGVARECIDKREQSLIESTLVVIWAPRVRGANDESLMRGTRLNFTRPANEVTRTSESICSLIFDTLDNSLRRSFAPSLLRSFLSEDLTSRATHSQHLQFLLLQIEYQSSQYA
jgi:hypothetical protein